MAKCELPHRAVLKVAIPVPLFSLFDYWPPTEVQAHTVKSGVRVRVPFGKTVKTGVVLAVEDISSSELVPERIRSAEQLLDDQPLLSGKDIQLLEWASRYYHHPLGEVIATAFPVALRQGKPAVLKSELYYGLSPLGQTLPIEQLQHAPRQQALLALFRSTGMPISLSDLKAEKTSIKALLNKGLIETLGDSNTLWFDPPAKPSSVIANPDQQKAIDVLTEGLGRFSVSLLQGITGSGKTEVYMQVINNVLKRGQQVLVLLPEITLTPQLEQRFRQRFNVPIVCFHSKFNDTQRLSAWLKLQQGNAAIMLGTRSALFTPFKIPGMIILDEEHDTSFKQQEGFRFSARDVAIARAKMLNIPVLLGSATPSLESLFNVERQRYRLLELPTRAGNAVEPEFQILDIRNKPLQSGLSDELITAITAVLAQDRQVLLFLNRRGFAPVLICHGCGWVSRCGYCDANMVIHAGDRRLRCHHCGKEQALPTQCPACKAGKLQPLGLGTERIEQTLKSLFPGKQVIRLDKDTTQRKGSLENYLEQIHSGEADIILGTQMLAKGHHFPDVTLVSILDIDSGLFSVDFHAAEKLAQMIMQVAGRAGRADTCGKVVLQTRYPQHPMLHTLIGQGYRSYAGIALQERHIARLPPYTFQALLRAHAANAKLPQAFLQAVCELIQPMNVGKTQVLGPVSAPMARRAAQFRFQLLLQSPQRKDLHHLLHNLLPELVKLKLATKVRWSLDVDPVDLY